MQALFYNARGFGLLCGVRRISMKDFAPWMADNRELDMQVIKQIWDETPKDIKISPEEHERRVLIAKNWCRYMQIRKAAETREQKLRIQLHEKALSELQKDDPATFEQILKQAPRPVPTEKLPPFFTPPIPGFFHGKREL